MSRPIRATIHIGALRNNLAVARKHAAGARVMAVIKANAYGHGMLRTAAALRAADGFAVLAVPDGIALRQAGFTQEILLLEGFFTADELPLLLEHDLATVIHSRWQLDALQAFSGRGAVRVWLKANTGMNRLGFDPDEFPAILDAMRGIGVAPTLMTHFACADEPTGVAEQLCLFDRLTGDEPLPRSMANSAALLRFPETLADWVRPGIMLYGASPVVGLEGSEFGLMPAMTLTSALIAVRELAVGESVGYGGTFTASSPMRVGVVACGYADGYPRHAPTGTPVLVEGKRTRLLGRVSMDMLAVDVSAIAQARAGSPVVLWGGGLAVELVAQAAGTISYELLCAVAPRVPVFEDDA